MCYCPISNTDTTRERISACGRLCEAGSGQGTSRLAYVRCRACVAALRRYRNVRSALERIERGTDIDAPMSEAIGFTEANRIARAALGRSQRAR